MLQGEAMPTQVKLDAHSRAESAKLNVARAWHVIEATRELMSQSSLSKFGDYDYDRAEAMLTAAVTLLRETHVAMTKGDEVTDTPPIVL